MIPAFLRSLAALIRRLLSENRCLHLTEADAVELEMLAGLPWDEAPMLVLSEVARQIPGSSSFERDITARRIAPADITWAWLKLSRAFAWAENPKEEYLSFEEPREFVVKETKRAAACAEIAVLASRWRTAWDGNKRETIESDGADHTEGTSQGARAAWAFILPALQHHAADQSDYAECRRILELARRYERELDALPHPSDKYRRELEAMQ